MPKRKRTPEEIARKAKVRELMQKFDINALFKAFVGNIHENSLYEFESFDEKWNSKFPKILQSWEANWPKLSTYLKYTQDVQVLIYTTNIIEGKGRQLRKVTKSKSVFPTDNIC